MPEILVTYADEPRPSLSKSGTWLASLQWAERMRPLLTARAYSGFCLSAVASRAAKERDYRAATALLYSAFRYGSPRPWRVAAFLGVWLMPSGGARTFAPDRMARQAFISLISAGAAAVPFITPRRRVTPIEVCLHLRPF